MTSKLAILCTLLLGCSTALADEAAAPAPPPGAKDLECMVGTWKATGTFEAGGEKATVHATYACKSAAKGFGVRCHLTMKGVPGMDSYELDDVWGYDAETNQVHWYTVTNAGETHDHVGTVKDNAFRGKFEGKRGGKPFVETVEFKFHGPKNVAVSSVVTVDGKPVEKVAMTMTMQPAKG